VTIALGITISDRTLEYVMVEAREGYFEASRHMLVAMQKLMTEKYSHSFPWRGFSV
jgi:hypothetical protein